VAVLTLVNGREVVSIDHVGGVQSGEMKMGPKPMPPTNKKVGYLVAHAVEYGDDNLIHKERAFVDIGTMLGQLGLSPMPVRPATDKPATAGEMQIARDDQTERSHVDALKRMNALWNAPPY